MGFQINNGVLEKYTGTTPDVIIPSCITEIGEKAFKGNNSLKSVIITGNVKIIGGDAFSDCTNLEIVVLPESMEKIGCAFARCSSLKHITIPKGIKVIEPWTFSSCDNLESVILPEGMEKIGNYAFADCHNLKKVVIPESLTETGSNAFSNCSSLESVILPEGMKEIESYAFIGCNYLEKIVIPESVTSIGYNAFEHTEWLADKKASAKDAVIINGIVIAKADSIGDSVNLEGVRKIQEETFRGCQQIKEFIISDGVDIGYNALATENDFNICLKSHIISVNISVRNHYVEMIKKGHGRLNSFDKATCRLFDFIGADMEQKEFIFDELETPEYRYPLAVFMANAYESEFFRMFVDVHKEKITEYAEKNAPDLLKFIGGKD